MPLSGAHSTTASAALSQATLALVRARPRQERAIRAAQQLLAGGLTQLADGIQFADGVIVRRPSGACTHPPCQAQITCPHELAFQLLQDVPQLLAAPTSGSAPTAEVNGDLVRASCRVCRRVISVRHFARHWATHDEHTAAPPPKTGPACRYCGLVLEDRAAWVCHTLAEHTHPAQARIARLLFLKHRWVLAGLDVSTELEEELCSTPS
jgi:hypothetical protein